MNLKLLFTGILPSMEVEPVVASAISDWSERQEIDGYSSYRTRIRHLNNFNQKYSYEFELHNESGSEMQIHVAIAPEGVIPRAVDYHLSYVKAGASHTISPIFCTSGPNDPIKVWWTGLSYK